MRTRPMARIRVPVCIPPKTHRIKGFIATLFSRFGGERCDSAVHIIQSNFRDSRIGRAIGLGNLRQNISFTVNANF